MFHVPLPNVRVAYDRAGVLTTILSALWCCHAADQILLLKFSVKADFNQFRLVHSWRAGRYGLYMYEGFSLKGNKEGDETFELLSLIGIYLFSKM